MKILIAVDDSDFAGRVVEFAIAHRTLLGPTPDVTLATAVPAIPSHAARFLSPEQRRCYFDDEAEKALRPARARLQEASITAKEVQLQGHPPTVIAAHAASGGFELLMMGSHGHSSAANLVLGSVVTGVLAKCLTPVLVVR